MSLTVWYCTYLYRAYAYNPPFCKRVENSKRHEYMVQQIAFHGLARVILAYLVRLCSAVFSDQAVECGLVAVFSDQAVGCGLVWLDYVVRSCLPRISSVHELPSLLVTFPSSYGMPRRASLIHFCEPQ